MKEPIKYYVISEEELRELIYHVYPVDYHLSNYLRDKSKQPVELVAEGKFAIEPDNSLWVGEYPLKNLIVNKNNIKIYIVKVKE